MTLLPEVEHALMAAIGTPRRAPRRRLLGPAVTVAMVGVSVVIFVGALVLLAGRHPAGHPASGGATSTSYPSTRQELLQTLGVLRHPQSGRHVSIRTLPQFHLNPTAPLPATGPQRHGTPDRTLVRTVVVRGTPYAAVLIPTRYAATRAAPISEQLNIAVALKGVLARGRITPVYEAGPISVRGLRTSGVMMVPGDRGNFGAFVVPDGVAKVRIGPGLSLVTPRGDHRSTQGLTLPGRIAPVTAAVHDNVAGFRLGPVHATRHGSVKVILGIRVRLATTWYAPDGRVIAAVHVPAAIWVRTNPGTR
jgi:hypothetical protein